jgi:hypothetical protein
LRNPQHGKSLWIREWVSVYFGLLRRRHTLSRYMETAGRTAPCRFVILSFSSFIERFFSTSIKNLESEWIAASKDAKGK